MARAEKIFGKATNLLYGAKYKQILVKWSIEKNVHVLKVITLFNCFTKINDGITHHMESLRQVLGDDQLTENAKIFSESNNIIFVECHSEFTKLSDFAIYRAINRAVGQSENFILGIEYKKNLDQNDWIDSVFSIKSLPENAEEKYKAKVRSHLTKLFGSNVEFVALTDKLNVTRDQLDHYRNLIEINVNQYRYENIVENLKE